MRAWGSGVGTSRDAGTDTLRERDGHYIKCTPLGNSTKLYIIRVFLIYYIHGGIYNVHSTWKSHYQSILIYYIHGGNPEGFE